ncbi:MAG: DUF4278 domain-containing protein [Hydrococcus sp. RU_2_2]|nr:DUF4278 domain-containing protein [Hydrococcus sp. RU_2_2]NJP19726.1 DUF4278 domain-containing protein [Hydrococcus sp. CRU_1_1]NJQ97521.1 DUF4278 domain-containing protein [Hydrococcus sp. CSU_1_8]
MKLIFRGAQYEYQPIAPEGVEDSVNGTYRGASSTIHHYLQLSRRRKSSQEMIYRGIHYRNVEK